MLAALFAALALLATGQTSPETAPQTAPQPGSQADPSATQLPEVVVDGRRPREAATEFVEEIGAAPMGAQTARWNGPICVSVSNVRAPFGQYLVDHVSAEAAALGLDVGEPGCEPNVIIMATQDGRAMARHLVSEAGVGFRPTDGPTNPSRAALREFQDSDAPVRWWHVSMPVGEDFGELAVRLRGSEAPTLNVHAGSRLTSSIRYDIGWVIIVVDMNRTKGVPLGTVADYVSMVALAQIDPDADLKAFDTVLNVFDNPNQGPGLSNWDQDYLKALYTTRNNRMNQRQRQGELIDSLVHNQGAQIAKASDAGE